MFTKKSSLFILGLALMLLFSACNDPASSPASQAASDPVSSAPSSSVSQPASDEPADKVAVNIAALRGPTAMGMVKLMQDNEDGKASNDYAFSLVGAADEVSANIVNGSLDIAAVPVNLASVLYNRTEGGVKVIALNTLGVLYVLETGDSIQSITDLEGKTIYSTGKGTTPEFSLNHVLAQNGISAEVEFRSEASELATLLEMGEAEIAVLPEPYVTTVTTKNENLRVALSLSEEWDKVKGDGGSMVTGAVIVRTAFLEENKDAVDAFLAEYKESVAYTETNPAETAELIAKEGIVPSAAIAATALPKCNVVYRDGDEMKKDISGYLQVLFDANPQSVGGKLPDAEFYYQK